MAKNNLLLALVVFSFIFMSGCATEETLINPGDVSNKKESFERNYPDVVKGLVEPSGDHFKDVLNNELDSIKTLGVNTLAVYVDYSYVDGRFMLETAFGGPRFADNAKDESISLIKEAKRNGFAVHLALSFGGGQNRKFDVPLEKFLSDTKTEAVKWAEIAEEYQVEYFAPASEIDYQIFREYFNENWSSSQKQDEAVKIANEFHDDVLPEIKKVFGGRTIYQYGLFNPGHLSKGYDYFGTSVNQISREIDNFRDTVKQIYAYAEESAIKSDSGWLVTEVWIPFREMIPESPEPGELWLSPNGASYDELQDDFYKIVFEEYENFEREIKPSGLLFTSYLMPWSRVKDRPAEKVIRTFFQDNKQSEQGIGNLCSGKEECKEFCLSNRGRCEDYCEGKQNELCKIIFPPEEPYREESVAEKHTENERQEECEGTKTKFDYAPVNLDKTLVMLPLGIMVDDHITPIDHHYFQNFYNEELSIEVYSPGDGFITDIQQMPAEEGKGGYRIIIEHTCTISSIYIYVLNLPEKIKAYASRTPRYGIIPVTAGELIGYYVKNLDYNLVDTEVTLPGFIIPEHYEAEPWKIHVPNTYDYFNEPVRSQLIAKSVRTIEPISGKIDYDIDGRLIGNWFLEGINYDRGPKHGEYWLKQLSFAYDAYDPERVVLSIGGYGGEDSGQFGVKGNLPDPADVGVENGLVKYELIGYDYIKAGGGLWDRKSFAKILKTEPADNVQGVVLVQMIENRKIKFEAFPGKIAAQVSGFTNNAKVYER